MRCERRHLLGDRVQSLQGRLDRLPRHRETGLAVGSQGLFDRMRVIGDTALLDHARGAFERVRETQHQRNQLRGGRSPVEL